MNDHKLSESVVSITLIILLLLLVNPFGFWMPTQLLMTIILVAAVLFAVFAAFVWREKAHDEREELHALRSGRAAFLMGAGVLMIGIITQSIRHTLDPWLVAALGVMLISKAIGLLYNRSNY